MQCRRVLLAEISTFHSMICVIDFRIDCFKTNSAVQSCVACCFVHAQFFQGRRALLVVLSTLIFHLMFLNRSFSISVHTDCFLFRQRCILDMVVLSTQIVHSMFLNRVFSTSRQTVQCRRVLLVELWWKHVFLLLPQTLPPRSAECLADSQKRVN